MKKSILIFLLIAVAVISFTGCYTPRHGSRGDHHPRSYNGHGNGGHGY